MPPTMRVGIDLVQVSRINESLERFGERFLRKIFTDAEIEYATAIPSEAASRLAVRFAAKEATIKALGLADEGMSWRDIEVARASSGGCEIALHGRAAGLRDVGELTVSLTHEGDYAAAIVIATLNVHTTA